MLMFARNLLVSNGAIFSSRKESFMKSQMILRGSGITATQYMTSDKLQENDVRGQLNDVLLIGGSIVVLDRTYSSPRPFKDTLLSLITKPTCWFDRYIARQGRANYQTTLCILPVAMC